MHKPTPAEKILVDAINEAINSRIEYFAQLKLSNALTSFESAISTRTEPVPVGASEYWTLQTFHGDWIDTVYTAPNGAAAEEMLSDARLTAAIVHSNSVFRLAHTQTRTTISDL